MEKNKRLDDYQREHRKLLSEIEVLRKQRAPIENKLRKLNSRLHQVGMAIYDMKHAGHTPEVTDHAIVRYLERIEGVDILELKLKVSNHKLATKVGNVIVTVNEDLATKDTTKEKE